MKTSIVPAILADYPVIQNMARFYVYDRSRAMGWNCPKDGLFECIDFQYYFVDSDKKAYLIKVEGELAGFVLLNQTGLVEPVDWNMGEFFVLAKFQGKGVGSYVVQQIFRMHSGKWSIAVMTENVKALSFWRKVVRDAVGENFTEVFKPADELTLPDDCEPCDMQVFCLDAGGSYR